eukprot:EST47018.1 Hypothetical protein SS50377_12974 [Spironucleus salmonicida]
MPSNQQMVKKYKPLNNVSVPITMQYKATANIFKKFSRDVNLLKYNDLFNGEVLTQVLINQKQDFMNKCIKFDQCLEDIYKEMVICHQEMQLFFHQVTLVTDLKYHFIYQRLNNNEQSLQLPYQLDKIKEINPNSVQNFIKFTEYSAQRFEFDYQKYKSIQWPNNKYNQINLKRINQMQRIDITISQAFYNNNFLLHEPYKSSLDDVIDFIFNFRQFLSGKFTYRKLQKVNNKEVKHQVFRLTLDAIFNGCITNLYDKSSRKVSFLQSLFPLELVNIQQAEDQLFQNMNQQEINEESTKPAKYAQSFVNFDATIEQIKNSELSVVKNKFRKINFSECTLSFTNSQYLIDFNEYYQQFMGQYNIQLTDSKIEFKNIEYQSVDSLLSNFYSKFNYSTNSLNYKQFLQVFHSNSSVFTSAFLDFNHAIKYNFIRPITPRQQTDVIKYKNLYQSLKKQPSNLQMSYEIQQFNQRKLSVTFQMDQMSKLVIDDSSLSETQDIQQPVKFLNTEHLTQLTTSQQSYFKLNQIQLSTPYYAAINITKFPNFIEIFNEFLNFSSKLANLFQYSIQEIMKKIVESTYWGAVSQSTNETFQKEQKQFISKLVNKIKLTSTSKQYVGEHINSRNYREIMFQDNNFEIQREISLKFQRFVNFYIKNYIVEIQQYIILNLIEPFLTQIIRIFYCEIFSNLMFTCKLYQCASKPSETQFLVQIINQVEGYKNNFKELLKIIFKPFSCVKMINSLILNGKVGNYDELVIEEAQQAEDRCLMIIDDVNIVMEQIKGNTDEMMQKIQWFTEKYGYQVKGASFQTAVFKK